MRWVVTGAAGMLGSDVVAALRAAGQDVVPADRSVLDVTDPASAAAAVRGADVVVNCAAWTAVDDAEAQEDAAARVNAHGAGVVARAAADVGARLVHVSTDYVVGGEPPLVDGRPAPWPEDAPLAPASAYGRTKAAGERAVAAAGGDHLVVRTAWLYGRHGRCFPRTIAALARQRELDVVADQVGQPTWTADLADLVLRLVDAGAPSGVYHGTSGGAGSWFDFAREVVVAAGLPAERVRPTTTEAFPRPAPRPAWSVLGHDALHRAGVAPIADWSARWHAAAPTVLEGV